MRKHENKSWWIGGAICCLLLFSQFVFSSPIVWISSISIREPASDTLYLGQRLTLTCEFTPVDATMKVVCWTSDDETVATVKAINDSMAVVTPHKEGKVTIYATTEYGDIITAKLFLKVIDGLFEINDIVYKIIDEEPLAASVASINIDGAIIPDSIEILGSVHPVKYIHLQPRHDEFRISSLTIPASITSITDDCIFESFDHRISLYISDLEAWCHTRVDWRYVNKIFLYLNGELITDLKILSSYKYITNAVSKNVALKSLVIEPGVIFEGGVFAGCSNLERVILPEGWQEIPDSIFSGCKKLKEINFPMDLRRIGKSSFTGCGLSSIVLPESLQEIGSGAFGGCGELKEIRLPDNLQIIGSSAFYGCGELKEIKLPDNLQIIGSAAFKRSALVSIVIPDRVKVLDNSLFEDCFDLQSVKCGFGLERIERHVFENCYSLSEIYIPASVSYISAQIDEASDANYGYREGCDEYYYNYAYRRSFHGCRKLTKITVAPDNKDFVDIDGVLFDRKGVLLYYPEGRTDIYYEIPEGTKAIATYAFWHADSLRTITLPTTMKWIDRESLGGKYLETVASNAYEPPEMCSRSIFDYRVLNTIILYVPTGTREKYENCSLINSSLYKVIELDRLGIKCVDEDLVKVYASEGSIVVSGAESGQSVTVYNTSGVVARETVVPADGRVEIALPAGAMYIVNVGGTTRKVIL